MQRRHPVRPIAARTAPYDRADLLLVLAVDVSCSIGPAERSARSYMLRWLRLTMNSFGSPSVSGSRFIAAGSSRAMQAAAPSMSAAAAPAVTMPASAPVAATISRHAAAWTSGTSKQDRAASAIAATTSGAIRPPDRRVLVP